MVAGNVDRNAQRSAYLHECPPLLVDLIRIKRTPIALPAFSRRRAARCEYARHRTLWPNHPARQPLGIPAPVTRTPLPRIPFPQDTDQATASAQRFRGEIRTTLDALDTPAPANEGDSAPAAAHLHQRFRVTFVGGPRHGQNAWFDVPPATVDGYEARTWIGDAGKSIRENWVAFAPTGLGVQEYLVLLQRVPELQTGLRWRA